CAFRRRRVVPVRPSAVGGVGRMDGHRLRRQTDTAGVEDAGAFVRHLCAGELPAARRPAIDRVADPLSAGLILTGEAAKSAVKAGGKGAALAKLAATFPVPSFLVVSPDAFDEAGLKSETRDKLAEALKVLGAGPFAVRSSGREEDGADSAHAGQFETELNVAAPDVAAAAHRVWRSGFSETLAQYRIAKGLSGAPQPPAVVVQVMVKARAAGVAFSADPVSGDRSVVVVSAINGLADKLVGGEADGDSYRIGALVR